MKRTRDISELLPVIQIEEHKLILADGRVAIAFEIAGYELEGLSAAEHNSFNQMLAGAMSGLPSGSIIQKLDVYYQRKFHGDSTPTGYFTRKDVEYLYNRPVMNHRCFLCLSFGQGKQPRPTPVSSFNSLGKSLLKNPLSGIERRMGLAEQLGYELAHQLAGHGIRFTRLEDEALKTLCLSYFNLAFDPGDIPRGLNRQFSPAINGMALGDQQIHVISASGQGAVLHHHMKDKRGVDNAYAYPLAFELNFPHMVSTCIRIEDRERILRSLDLQKRLNASLGPLMGQDNRIQAEEIDLFTEEVRAHNLRLVSLNLSVILWEGNADRLQRNTDRTVAAFRQMSGAECLVESMDTSNIFFANMPGNAWQNYRWLLMSAENASVYMPFITLQSSQGEGVRLSDIYRNPLQVRLFNTHLNNQNMIVVGPSGSGKSFTIGSFIIQRFEQGHRQIILDVGGTYKNAIAALDGKYFEINPEKPLKFNPFVVSQDGSGNYLLSTDKLVFLTTLLSLLWKGTEGEKLSQTERSVFSELIPAFYTQMDTEVVPTLEWFYLWLQMAARDEAFQHYWDHFKVEELLLNLRPFVEGEYKNVLGAEETAELSDFPLIAFDLAGIKSNPQLYPIIALILMELSMEQIRKFPDSRKFIYADEAWSFLAESMGDFLEYLFRTIRKNNGSIAIITQGVSEIESSSAGPAIIANADTRIILNHTDKSQIDRVGKVFGFTRHELDKIRALRVFESRRELGVKQGDFFRIYGLEVSPSMRAVLSSRPEERNHLQKLIADRGEVRAGLNQYLEDRKEVSHA